MSAFHLETPPKTQGTINVSAENTNLQQPRELFPQEVVFERFVQQFGEVQNSARTRSRPCSRAVSWSTSPQDNHTTDATRRMHAMSWPSVGRPGVVHQHTEQPYHMIHIMEAEHSSDMATAPPAQHHSSTRDKFHFVIPAVKRVDMVCFWCREHSNVCCW